MFPTATTQVSRLIPLREIAPQDGQRGFTARATSSVPSRWLHHRSIPALVDLIEAGAVTPAQFLTQRQPPAGDTVAHISFNTRQTGWVEVGLLPAAG
ncbi:MAG: hypothetical protein U0075_09670 [Thermomicrobiales bacterium]